MFNYWVLQFFYSLLFLPQHLLTLTDKALIDGKYFAGICMKILQRGHILFNPRKLGKKFTLKYTLEPKCCVARSDVDIVHNKGNDDI